MSEGVNLFIKVTGEQIEISSNGAIGQKRKDLAILSREAVVTGSLCESCISLMQQFVDNKIVDELPYNTCSCDHQLGCTAPGQQPRCRNLIVKLFQKETQRNLMRY